jgi:protoporphyrinogen oxidase
LDKVIHILGSGPMGLGVAYQLIKKGYKPLYLEADDRIGGMTASFDFNGIDIERFYHFHCKTDDAFFQILKD